MKKKAWVVTVNMGYGHQRTSFPLRHLAVGGEIINANDYQDIPEKDQKIWERSRQGYELISRFGRIPLIGELAFAIFDRIQRVLSFYPKRDLSKPNFQLRQTYSIIKKGWGKHLIEKLKKEHKPLITTFFTPAHMAEHFGYPGDIYCVVCDTDISRTWAPLNPKTSKIQYFTPTMRATDRLELYGVKPKNIWFTGFPLPLENIGTRKMEILKQDLKYRLINLDPKKKYYEKYQILVDRALGKLPEKANHPLTIMFAVGGAGAQKKIGINIVKQLKEKIKSKEVKIILVAGIREKIRDYFIKNTKGLPVEIIFSADIASYFQKFNQALRKTDILWTKPSELSFYSTLGLPVIIAPSIGSQEQFNKRWLLNSGFGFLQKNPKYINQWLFDWIDRGYLAEAAMQGFIEGEKLGTLNIEKICFG